MTLRNKIIYWISTIWLSTGMVSTGLVQLFKQKGAPGAIDSLMHLGFPIYLLPFLGVCKIIGVITVLIAKFPLLKEWAYAGFFCLMAGAIYSHIASGDSFKEIFPSALLIIMTLISWHFRPVARKIISIKY
jgi:DoxX-like family